MDGYQRCGAPVHLTVARAGSPHSLPVWSLSPAAGAGLTQPGVWGSAGLESKTRGQIILLGLRRRFFSSRLPVSQKMAIRPLSCFGHVIHNT